MSWYSTFFNKDPGYEMHKKNNAKIPDNIYENGVRMKDHVKRFNVIHYVFKYKFLVPLIYLGNIILRKHIITKIPKQSHNRNLLIIDKAFDEAIKKWHIYYLRNSGNPATRKSRAYWLKRAKREKILHSIRNYLVTMYMYDTAYREFVNVFVHELAHGMTAEYSKPEYKDKKTGHLFFTTDMYDVHYYVLEKALRYQTDLSVQETEKLLQDYYIYRQMRQQQKKQQSIPVQTQEEKQ